MEARREEKHQERETVKAGSFEDMERSLPALPFRFTCSLVDNLSSYLGAHNPLAHPFNPATDAVWLIDNTAFRSSVAPHHWTTEFVAAFFLKDSGKNAGDVVADIASKLGIAKGDAAEDTIAERVQPFVDAIGPARRIQIHVGGAEGPLLKLGASDRSGISRSLKRFPREVQAADADTIESCADCKEESPEMRMTTVFAEPEGWAVISDVDDTIKRTLTSSPLGILRETFVSPPTPIASMPELYTHIRQALSSPPFFYLSASPYNLYPFLRAFIREHYPQGTLHLREASWMNLAGLLGSLTQGTLEYKVARMEKLHGWFPKRRVVCVGDSTQTDPESYGRVCRKYPGWIKAVFIRKVTDVAQMEGTDKNDDERFEKAFDGVPRDVWRTFEDPNELYAAVDALVK
ncbi:MAG: hypothetical protein M1833_004183 [Piccolia ochrophora]|nr:MAG: hypothetical protein M1833_004183 [Piccolia ochrophora]